MCEHELIFMQTDDSAAGVFAPSFRPRCRAQTVSKLPAHTGVKRLRSDSGHFCFNAKLTPMPNIWHPFLLFICFDFSFIVIFSVFKTQM